MSVQKKSGKLLTAPRNFCPRFTFIYNFYYRFIFIDHFFDRFYLIGLQPLLYIFYFENFTIKEIILAKW